MDSDTKDTKDTNEGLTPTDPIESSFKEADRLPILEEQLANCP